jgi:hypothetical protein
MNLGSYRGIFTAIGPTSARSGPLPRSSGELSSKDADKLASARSQTAWALPYTGTTAYATAYSPAHRTAHIAAAERCAVDKKAMAAKSKVPLDIAVAFLGMDRERPAAK